MAIWRFTGVLAFISLVTGFAAVPAYADFRYIPHAPVPVAPPATPDDMASIIMQAPTVRTVETAPVPTVLDNHDTTMPAVMSAPMAQQQSQALAHPASAAVAMGSGGQLAEGFGKHVPLVMALREITPSSYQLGYGPGVSLGTMVDWNGGQPWRDVLKAVLSPLGLQASEQGSVVYIDSAR